MSKRPAQKDLYDLLGVPKTATTEEIRKAYKKGALKWHPDKFSTAPPKEKAHAEEMFKEISGAAHLLMDERKRRIYDETGDVGYANSGGEGPPPGSGAAGGGHGMSGADFSSMFSDADAQRMFASFFGGGGGDPFGMFGGLGGGGGGFPGMSFSFGGPPRRGSGRGAGMRGGPAGFDAAPGRKGEPFVVEVPCTLEELFTGCDKRRKITRKRLDAATGAVREVATVLEIKILPGFKPGTRITFEGEGDEHPGVAAGDVVFVVAQKPHDRLTRDSDNLTVRVPCSLTDALAGGSRFSVTGIDGTVYTITSAPGEVVTPATRKIIAGAGMPRRKHGGRGDLIVSFDIQFPSRTVPRAQLAPLFG